LALSENRRDRDKRRGQFVGPIEDLPPLAKSIRLQDRLGIMEDPAGDVPVETAAGAMVQFMRQLSLPIFSSNLK
jgi:hypothetical protein